MRALILGLGTAILLAGCTDQNQTATETVEEIEVAKSGGEASGDEAVVSDAPVVEEVSSEAASEPIGQPAPSFEGLTGVDDKVHSLKDHADASAVVVAFICNHCPVAAAYEDRLIALQNDYEDKGVQLVAINVNNLEDDKLPAMKERATEKGFNFPYLYDPSQEVGRDYGATVTPHIFLLDDERRFAYIGPIDDNQDEAKVTEQYLRDAIDAVLAGDQPATTNVKPFGCGIKYE